MKGAKGFLYILFGLLGLAFVAITIFLILIQLNIEMNLALTAFCGISWLLFFIAASQIRNIETEKSEIMWKKEKLTDTENEALSKL